ncbi:DUF2314 domain-containing protein [Cupriavidus sp. 2SB]|uniref:DUF2314 domain-containing protein n=1 Tax=Cupriavidus sp. 2SB TaxID=2502199 RepID=UPI0010F881F6|nr:DUF2314 domain-containing protein [Cupriavidus sp. 2SB]
MLRGPAATSDLEPNNKTKRVRSILLLLVFFFTSQTYATPGQPLSAQGWQRQVVTFSVALYYLSPPSADPAKAARTLAADPRFAMKVVEKPSKAAQDHALLQVADSRNAARDYTPPSLESLRYFGRGLTMEQAQALQKAPRVIILTFAHPASQATAHLRRAEAFVAELVRQGQAIIWDEETREAFTPQVWESSRLRSWEADTPDVARQIVYHAYNNDGQTRVISLGMAKFGLPDLVINDTVWSLNTPLGTAMSSVGQQLVESGPANDKGLLEFRISGFRHAGARKRLREGVLAGGSGQGRVRLLEAPAEEGDPDNTLVALHFDTYPGSGTTERQTNFVKAVFGAKPDEVIGVRPNNALREASERARLQLPALQKAFQRGLSPGELLLVKAPFATTDDRREFMWVEVMEWTGEQIKGMLRSDPRFVPSLKAGQIVDVQQAEVFDYLHRWPDGRTEGNETAKLLK